MKDEQKKHVTTGEVFVNIYANYVHVETSNFYESGTDILNAEDVGEKTAEANGHLLAEAVTVFSRTNKTPGELEDSIDGLVDALRESTNQIEYLHKKFQETGTGNAVIAKNNTLTEKYSRP